MSIEYAEEHLRQLTAKACHGVDITFPPAFGKPQVSVWRGSFFVARFSDAVRVRLTVDGKSVQGRVVADGKTAVEALHRLFASYACIEDYGAVEVAQFHSNEPRVFVPDEARYEIRFLEITDPALRLNC